MRSPAPVAGQSCPSRSGPSFPARALLAAVARAAALAVALTTASGVALAQRAVPADLPGHYDRMRGATPIPEETTPPPLTNPDNSDVRRSRAYAMQPPVVPHKIEGYQLDRHANRCMFCHARTRTEQSQAPMISVTHFQDRDGNHLAELSPRRYFCLQCHVPQAAVTPLVENRFTDVETMLRRGGSPSVPRTAPGQAAPRPQGSR
ncbi:MAG: nitrate reductase cytochrome c-type subunit [Aromatoleum sp.]|jgi:cytochrome c-type protein NapB|uniref:nitrate reductase cytochrome c-type subunit n=1 Tax=Aromatoleum sp. TaxID=2307007 RepID=UPI002894491D|nr:nitrate reductase cytochrome c-type subunit [Aromatoleum sp.]MDT3672428.1 nitrate reductase cytochrome c-type subunit [Aromatoleum sp.]